MPNVLIQNEINRLDAASSATSSGRIPITQNGKLQTATVSQIQSAPLVITDNQRFIGIESILLLSAGTWTITRVAQGDYVYRKTAADDTTIIGIDITEAIRTTTDQGLQITGFNYIFRNTTADLDAHTVTLDRIEYVDSTPVSVNSIPLTGTLGIGQDADPQVDAITVTTPVFNNTANSKYVLEVTVDAAGTSAYDFIGAMLTFSRDDS